MDPEVTAALLVAISSVLVAVVSLAGSLRAQRRSADSAAELETLKDQLAARATSRDAWVAYEFEARKRLYEECAPLLFQLSEHSERALGRIYGLARTAAAGNLDPGASWLSRGYYSSSTYYRLIAPLSVGRLLRRRLTHLDLSIDADVLWQYTVVRVLMDSFTDDFELAGRGEPAVPLEDRLEYQPHAEGASELRARDPRRYWQQGVPRGILDDAVTSLVVDDDRILDYLEFQAALADGSSTVRRAFDRIGYLFRDFHPRTRPVLWRILVAQAGLYEAILRAPRHGGPDGETLRDVTRVDTARLDWRAPSSDPADRGEVDQAIRVGLAYAQQRAEHYFGSAPRPEGRRRP